MLLWPEQLQRHEYVPGYKQGRVDWLLPLSGEIVEEPAVVSPIFLGGLSRNTKTEDLDAYTVSFDFQNILLNFESFTRIVRHERFFLQFQLRSPTWAAAALPWAEGEAACARRRAISGPPFLPPNGPFLEVHLVFATSHCTLQQDTAKIFFFCCSS